MRHRTTPRRLSAPPVSSPGGRTANLQRLPCAPKSEQEEPLGAHAVPDPSVLGTSRLLAGRRFSFLLFGLESDSAGLSPRSPLPSPLSKKPAALARGVTNTTVCLRVTDSSPTTCTEKQQSDRGKPLRCKAEGPHERALPLAKRRGRSEAEPPLAGDRTGYI
ncbi:hypothetical protein PVAP13_8KG044351 [Panicum virgatum]|uniref:Uncharacterized protein n=1 Tax=Panicum virgatum TaxID=38727 RepID=A0A8T0PD72_PANVG|nr:hypothetical protein PVAP13_8KG044351 [Panicum virgatum]